MAADRIPFGVLAGAFAVLAVACGGSSVQGTADGGAGRSGAFGAGGGSAGSGVSGGGSAGSGASNAAGGSGGGAGLNFGGAGAAGLAGASGLGAWGGAGASPSGCASFTVQSPTPCWLGVPCPCGGPGPVPCDNVQCPWKAVCNQTSAGPTCTCPAGTVAVSCLDGRPCDVASCGAFQWGCQTVDPAELDPGCTGKLSKVMGTCHCQNGVSHALTCGIDASCDALCLGAVPGAVVPSASPRGTGAPVGGACTQNGALVCGTTASCSANDLVLQCQNGVYAEVWQCPQTQPCGNLKGNTSVACMVGALEFNYAIEATPCVPELAAACTFDRGKVLVCETGSWKVAQTCAAGTPCDHYNPGEGNCPAASAPGGCVGCK